MNRPELAPIFGDGMVIHRSARLWGKGLPKAEFQLELQGQTCPIVVDANGRWEVRLALEPGGPFVLRCDGAEWILNVWVGDVWLCAGQSNMERSLAAGASWPSDADQWRGDPGIRQLCLTTAVDFDQPRREIAARWIGADSAQVGQFSAVGFHFARELRQKTGVPQGLVLAAVGGSSVQSWLSEGSLKVFPEAYKKALSFKSPRMQVLQAAESARRELWYDGLNAADPPDPTAANGPWSPVRLPGTWEQEGGVPWIGSAWFRKRVSLAASPGRSRLRLGTLVDSDEAWVNGVSVGSTGYQYPLRRYEVPAGVLREGENEILVRVVAPRGGVSFTEGKPMSLSGETWHIDLQGLWEWKPGAKATVLPEDTFFPREPLGVHNAMLAPLVGLSLSAVLWYQGESNTENPAHYGPMMRALIAEVRSLWKTALPFLVVQLPLWGAQRDGASADGWSEVRDQQRRLTELPGVTLTVTLDQGEWNDIHPGEKKEVGFRLAQAARHIVFGEALPVWTGPLLSAAVVGEGEIWLTFEQAGTALKTADGAPLRGFWIAGGDREFRRAEGFASTNEVIVRAVEVPHPLWVRYAWASNPDANLVNSLGWPASPFRTDEGDDPV